VGADPDRHPVRELDALLERGPGSLEAGTGEPDPEGSAHDAAVRAFRVLLSAFVRGRVYLHFESPDEVVAALRDAAFATAELRRAAEMARLTARGRTMRLGHILEASST
jgi:hypothetical protein